MKSILKLAIIFAFASIFQISLLPAMLPFGFIPNLVLVIFIYLTLGKKFSESWKLAFFSGLILDTFSFYPLGSSMFSFVVISFAIGSFSKRFLVLGEKETFFVFLGVMALASFLNFWLILFLLKLFGSLGIFMDNLYSRSFEVESLIRTVFSDVICFSLLFWPMEKIRQVVGIYGRSSIKKTKFLS